MANSDKNILITPSVGLSTNPTIKFNGANNTPTTLRVLDDGTISFEATAGQLFSISDGLTGSIFSVNDISGIPSIEVLDTGLVKLNQYGGSTVFGASSAIQNGSSVNAKVSISTVSATTPGLIIKGVSSQTANLQEWQDSAGNVLAKIHYDGKLTIGYGAGGGIAIGSASFGGVTYNGISNPSGVISIPTFVIKGITSQTASLQEWQNSAGTLMARVAFDGSFTAGGFNGATKFIVDQFGTLSLGTNRGGTPTYLFVQSQLATDIGAVIKGHASQTANLQEWQNSSGTVLASINSSGYINSSGGIKASTHGYIYTSSTQGSVSFMIADGNAAYVPLVIKGAASQTANLQEWQNSSGTYVALVDYLGTVRGTNLASNNATYTATTMWGQGIGSVADYLGDSISLLANKSVRFNATASTVSVIVKGAASQTSDLQQWQNSAGSIVAKIGSAGTTLLSASNYQYAYPTVTIGDAAYGFSAEGAYFRYYTSPTSSGGHIWYGSANNSVLRMILGNNGTFGLKGISGQTANLQEWQDSAGTVLSRIGAYGEILIKPSSASVTSLTIQASPNFPAAIQQWQNSSGTTLAQFRFNGALDLYDIAPLNSNSGTYLSFTSGALNVSSRATTTSTLIVKGAASQTANLTEWQDSAGTVLSYITTSGALRINSAFGGTQAAITAGSAATIGAIIRGASSQTANLQEWQDSAGTVLARIRNDGVVIGPELRTTNNRVMAREESSGGTLTQTKATTTPSNPGTNLAKIYFRDGTNAGTLKLVVIAGASGAETTILDNIPQS